MHHASERAFPSTRRTFMKTTGAGAIAAASGSVLSAGTAAAQDEYAGMVVFTYDDSPTEDYRKTYPIHDEYDAPACVAACPGLMDGSRDFLLPGQLKEMHESGWEVMSHTLEHRNLGEVPITRDVEPGDTEVYVQSNVNGRYAGDPLLLSDGSTEVTATVAGRDSDGDDQYLIVEEPIDTALSSDANAWVRYTEEFTGYVLEEAKAQLEEWGATVTGFVYPYGRYDGLVERLVPEYYEAVPNARTARGGLNPVYRPDPLRLRRAYFEEGAMTEEELAAFMETVANEPDFGILGGHSHYDGLTEERIGLAIELARENDLKIVTLQEALKELGVLELEDGSEDDSRSGSTDGASEESPGGSTGGSASDDAPTETPSEEPDPDPGTEPQPSLWERILSFVRGLFGG